MANDEGLESFEGIADAAGGISDAAGGLGLRQPHSIDLIKDVQLQISVEVGRARMTIQDILQLGQGSVLELEKLAGEPLDIFVNGKHIAKGEAVIVNEKFGVRLTDILSPEDRLGNIGS
jgi:flagellar motor switch protein FliN/FliY